MTDTNSFINQFIQPVSGEFNRDFALLLPRIPEIVHTEDVILQGQKSGTVSTNLIKKYKAGNRIRLVEVYKNTEDREKQIFIRLVGTFFAVKTGYPFFVLDAAVSNLNFLSGQKEDTSTRIAVHFPQAMEKHQNLFFGNLDAIAMNSGISSTRRKAPSLPEFWGDFWSIQFQGIDLNRISEIRNAAWKSYERLCSSIPSTPDFDYTEAQHQMVFKNSSAESRFFGKMGLSVAPETQAAFFSILTAGL